MIRTLLLTAALTIPCVGCLSTPPELVITDDGQVVEMTQEQKLEHLEAQYQEAKATIEQLKASAGFLPPGVDIAALSVLSGLAAALERKRRQMKAEIKSASETKVG